MRQGRRFIAAALLATAAFAGIAGFCERALPRQGIQRAVIRVAEMAGHEFNDVRGYTVLRMYGFTGSGPGLKWFYLAWAYLPAVIPYLIAFAFAMPFYHFLVRPSQMADGYTRCGGCGHILKGLSEPRCPECGLKI